CIQHPDAAAALGAGAAGVGQPLARVAAPRDRRPDDVVGNAPAETDDHVTRAPRSPSGAWAISFVFASPNAWDVQSSVGLTLPVLYMIVRASTVRPNQRVSGSRRESPAGAVSPSAFSRPNRSPVLPASRFPWISRIEGSFPSLVRITDEKMSTRNLGLGLPNIGTRLIAVPVLLAMAGPAIAQSIHGTATYRERLALPPTAA